MGTYGLMGGQAAAAETRGQMEGFGQVESLKSQAQNRKIQQEKWALQSALEMDKVKTSQMKLMAQQKKAITSGAMSTENMQYLTDKVSHLEKRSQAADKGIIGQIVQMFLGSKTPNKEVPSMQAMLNNNPEMAQRLGVKELRPVEINSDYDRRKVADLLLKQDPMFSVANKAEQKDMIDKAISSQQYLFGDSHLIDMPSFAKGVGTYDSMSAGSKARVEGNARGITTSAKATAAQENNKGTGVEAITPEEPTDMTTFTPKYVQDIIPGLGRGKRKSTTGGVIHQTAGSNYNTDRAKNEGLGAHITIDKDGTVYENADIDDVTWHAGPKGNSDKFGIELVGAYDEDSKEWDKLTEEQKASLTEVTTKLAKKYGLKPEDFINHPEIAAKTKGEGLEGRDLVRTSLDPNYVPSEASQSSEDGQSSTVGQSSMNRPYQNNNQSEADKILNELAGWGHLNRDERTAMMKNMDYVNSQLGGNASMGEVMSVMKDWKSSTETGGDRFSWQQQITDYNSMIDKDVANGDISAEEGEDTKRAHTNKVYRSQTAGKAQVVEDEDVAEAKKGGTTYREAVGQGLITEKALDKLMGAEVGMKSDKLSTKLKLDGSDLTHIVQAGDKLATKMETLLESGTIKKGFFGDLQQMITEYVPGEALSPGMEKMRSEMAKVDTELGNFVADYLRALSGQAVTQQERKDTFDRLGASFGKEGDVTVDRLRAFSGVNRDKVRHKADRLARRGFAGSGLEMRAAIGDIKMQDTKGSAAVAQASPKSKPAAGTTATEQIPLVEVSSFKELQETPNSYWMDGNKKIVNRG